MAFAETPEKLGLSMDDDTKTVYGVVIDQDWKNGNIMTVAAYLNGEAHMFVGPSGLGSTGTQKERISKAAKEFVNLAQAYLFKATKTETTSLPDTGKVFIYFLTNKGIYSAKEDKRNFENKFSSWAPLYSKCTEVMNAISPD